MHFSLFARHRRLPGTAVSVVPALVMGAVIVPLSCRTADAVDDSPAPAADAPFRAEDISIGEPISLPTAPPLTSPALPVAPPAKSPPSFAPAADAIGPPTAAGNGWLGLAVDDTLVTGRLVVVEVSPDGPAARAGVRPRDILLAINGDQLRNSDELAAALAAIGPGQRVKMAIGRDNRVEEVVAQASTRPPDNVSRDWQQSEPMIVPAAPAAAAPPPEALAPSVVIPAPAVVTSPAPAPPAPPAPPRPVAAVASLPAPQLIPALPSSPGRTALGVRTVPVDAGMQSRFRLTDARGAFVIGVVHDLPAAKAGVPPGSVIVAINHQPVRSPQDLTQLVTRGPVGTPLPIQYVLPGGQARQAEVVLQSLEQPLERALVGEGSTAPVTQPPPLEPAPYDARRVQPTTADGMTNPDPLARLEDVLRRVNGRLEQLERRLERLAPNR